LRNQRWRQLLTAITSAPSEMSLAGDVTPLLNILDALTGDRPALATWLRRFATSELATRIAARSYSHPNGFANVGLDVDATHQVGLHLWPAGEHRLGESNPHGHRWNFVSTVLCGEGLADTHYVKSGAGFRYLSYAYLNGTMTHIGEAHLAEQQVRE